MIAAVANSAYALGALTHGGRVDGGVALAAATAFSVYIIAKAPRP